MIHGWYGYFIILYPMYPAMTLKHVGDGIVDFNILKGTGSTLFLDISTYCFWTKRVEFQYVVDFFGRDIQHTTGFFSTVCL